MHKKLKKVLMHFTDRYLKNIKMLTGGIEPRYKKPPLDVRYVTAMKPTVLHVCKPY